MISEDSSNPLKRKFDYFDDFFIVACIKKTKYNKKRP